MTKSQSQLGSLIDAFSRLEEVRTYPEDLIHQESAIQRFEFTFELCWKVMQSIAAAEGYQEYGPKNAIRSAAQLGLIDNPEAWFDFLDMRNQISHIYKKELAEAIAKKVPDFIPLAFAFIETAKSRVQ